MVDKREKQTEIYIYIFHNHFDFIMYNSTTIEKRGLVFANKPKHNTVHNNP
jgi:hypothetical protein